MQQDAASDQGLHFSNADIQQLLDTSVGSKMVFKFKEKVGKDRVTHILVGKAPKR